MDDDAVSRFKENYRSQLIKAVEEFNPDIIYCHHLFLLAAYVRELFPEKFIIGQCHGSDLRQLKTSVRLQDYVLTASAPSTESRRTKSANFTEFHLSLCA